MGNRSLELNYRRWFKLCQIINKLGVALVPNPILPHTIVSVI